MKNIIVKLSFAFLLFLTLGCSKPEVDLIFGETPEERMGKMQKELKEQLTNAEYGWVGWNETVRAGAYGFYMHFDNKDRVDMIADINATSSTEIKESSYRLRQITGPVLAFETYNYLHLLNDPNPDVLGGTRGEGLGSDIEFNVLRYTPDSVYLAGRKYTTLMILVKASQEEQQQFLNGEYAESIAETKQFFTDNPVTYFEFDDVKHQIFFNAIEKKIEAVSYVDGEIVGNSGQAFSFTLDGVWSVGGMEAGAHMVDHLERVDGKFYAVTKGGEKSEVLPSTESIVPLNKMIGVKHASMRSPYLTYYPGTSEDGLNILKRYHEGLGNRATGYTFNSGYIDLKWDLVNERITMSGFSSQNGGSSGWTTTIVYDYNFDEQTGQYRLTKRTAASGGYTSIILDQLDDFLLNSAFTIEYFFESGNVYGKIKGVEREEVEMTMQLL